MDEYEAAILESDWHSVWALLENKKIHKNAFKMWDVGKQSAACLTTRCHMQMIDFLFCCCGWQKTSAAPNIKWLFSGSDSRRPSSCSKIRHWMKNKHDTLRLSHQRCISSYLTWRRMEKKLLELSLLIWILVDCVTARWTAETQHMNNLNRTGKTGSRSHNSTHQENALQYTWYIRTFQRTLNSDALTRDTCFWLFISGLAYWADK